MSVVQYGSEIVLRHQNTKKLLSAPGVPYCHPNSSGQDQVTCASTESSKCIWIVKPPDGYPDDHLFGESVGNGAFVRLENRAWRKNLHSHLGPWACFDKTDRKRGALG